MDDAPNTDPGASGKPRTAAVARRNTWIIALVLIATLVICGCGSAVFLTLTGIIAEPETVIEQILRALVGS